MPARLINLLGHLATLACLLIAALSLAWVILNWMSGCGAIDPVTRQADMDACIYYPGR